MDKMAVYVEGKTEALFVKKLIEEIAGDAVQIEYQEKRGGGRAAPALNIITVTRSAGQKYYVLLVDCGGDKEVNSRIRDDQASLTGAGHSKILGVRDVRPTFLYADVPTVEAGFRRGVNPSLAPVEFILAVMEIEAWFLAETTHFARIAPAITIEAIKTRLGFDPENDDLEQRPAPSDDLRDCYGIGGKQYGKSEAQVQKTINALDYAQIYIEVRKKFRHLERLIHSIEEFLS